MLAQSIGRRFSAQRPINGDAGNQFLLASFNALQDPGGPPLIGNVLFGRRWVREAHPLGMVTISVIFPSPCRRFPTTLRPGLQAARHRPKRQASRHLVSAICPPLREGPSRCLPARRWLGQTLSLLVANPTCPVPWHPHERSSCSIRVDDFLRGFMWSRLHFGPLEDFPCLLLATT